MESRYLWKKGTNRSSFLRAAPRVKYCPQAFSRVQTRRMRK